MWKAIVFGAVSGFASAAVVDYDAFRQWPDWHAAVEYDWRRASLRWVQGAVSGAVAASPLAYFFGS